MAEKKEEKDIIEELNACKGWDLVLDRISVARDNQLYLLRHDNDKVRVRAGNALDILDAMLNTFEKMGIRIVPGEIEVEKEELITYEHHFDVPLLERNKERVVN